MADTPVAARRRYYLTTAIAYANSAPGLHTLYEVIGADAIARWHRMRGDEIPVAGRLMALADVYDALTSKRVYKPAFSHERTLEMLTLGDGRTAPEQFDPAVLGAFIELQDTFKQVSNAYRDEDAQSHPIQESPVVKTPESEENGESHG